jgi:sialic acid synthase SpsE
MTIKIGNRIIGRDHASFIIAEMSGNHNQSQERAMGIVEAVAKTGAHALNSDLYAGHHDA